LCVCVCARENMPFFFAYIIEANIWSVTVLFFLCVCAVCDSISVHYANAPMR
jgi:hypothetical protein